MISHTETPQSVVVGGYLHEDQHLALLCVLAATSGLGGCRGGFCTAAQLTDDHGLTHHIHQLNSHPTPKTTGGEESAANFANRTNQDLQTRTGNAYHFDPFLARGRWLLGHVRAWLHQPAAHLQKIHRAFLYPNGHAIAGQQTHHSP